MHTRPRGHPLHATRFYGFHIVPLVLLSLSDLAARDGRLWFLHVENTEPPVRQLATNCFLVSSILTRGWIQLISTPIKGAPPYERLCTIYHNTWRSVPYGKSQTRLASAPPDRTNLRHCNWIIFMHKERQPCKQRNRTRGWLRLTKRKARKLNSAMRAMRPAAIGTQVSGYLQNCTED